MIGSTIDGGVVDGQTVNSSKVAFDTNGDVYIGASQNTMHSLTESQNSSASVGLQATLGSETGAGVSVQGSLGNSRTEMQSTTHNNSSIKTDNLVVRADDLYLIGANVATKDADIQVDDLVIGSVQDSASINSESTQLNAGVMVGPGTFNVNGGATLQTGEGSYQGVQQVSSLDISGNYDIRTSRTIVNGAELNAVPGQGNLITDPGGLIVTDLQNHSEFATNTRGANVSIGRGSFNLTPNIGGKHLNDYSTTYGRVNATVNGDTVVSDKPANAATPGLDDFLAKPGQAAELQEAGNLFGKDAFKTVGDIGMALTEKYRAAEIEKAEAERELANPNISDDRRAELLVNIADAEQRMAEHQQQYELFKDGGAGKVALHTIAGGLTAAVGGDSIGSSALAAGAAEAFRPMTAQEKEIVQNLSSTLIGSVLGGDAGANIALSAELNNRQLHPEEMRYIEKYSYQYSIAANCKQMADAKGDPSYFQKCNQQYGEAYKLGSRGAGHYEHVLQECIKSNAKTCITRDEATTVLAYAALNSIDASWHDAITNNLGGRTRGITFGRIAGTNYLNHARDWLDDKIGYTVGGNNQNAMRLSDGKGYFLREDRGSRRYQNVEVYLDEALKAGIYPAGNSARENLRLSVAPYETLGNTRRPSSGFETSFYSKYVAPSNDGGDTDRGAIQRFGVNTWEGAKDTLYYIGAAEVWAASQFFDLDPRLENRARQDIANLRNGVSSQVGNLVDCGSDAQRCLNLTQLALLQSSASQSQQLGLNLATTVIGGWSRAGRLAPDTPPRRVDVARGTPGMGIRNEGFFEYLRGTDQIKGYTPSGTIRAQMEPGSCVAASCRNVTVDIFSDDQLMIAMELSERQIGARLGTSADGTYLSNVVPYWRTLGISAKTEVLKIDTPARRQNAISILAAATKSYPALVNLRLANEYHAVVVDKVQGGWVYIRDPLPYAYGAANANGSAYAVTVDEFVKYFSGRMVQINSVRR